MSGVPIATFLLLSAPGALPTVPPQEAVAKAENASFSARLVSHRHPEYETAIRIKDKRSQQEADLNIQIRTRAIDTFQLVGQDRLLAGGKLPRGGHHFAVVSLAEAQLEASFWTYQYALSPDGGLLLMQSHYPRMGIAGSRRSILTLYDFTAPKQANFLDGANTNYTHEAGRPVYPPWNYANRSYERFNRPRHIYQSPFLWSEDGKRVVFVSYSEEEGEYFLALIEPMDRYEEIEILRRPVRLRDFVESTEQIPDSERQKDRIVFHVRELRWKDSDHVEAMTGRNWLPDWIELKLPQEPEE